jgi:hypothetical protein
MNPARNKQVFSQALLFRATPQMSSSQKLTLPSYAYSTILCWTSPDR